MKIFAFTIGLFTNLFIILLMRVSTKSFGEYEDGMLFGAHIARERLDEPEVVAIRERAVTMKKRFDAVNLVLGIAVCFLAFVNMVVFAILLTVWLMVYAMSFPYVVLSPFRKLYRLKTERGWHDERAKTDVVLVDLKAISAKPADFYVRWHIAFTAAILLIGGLLFYAEHGQTVSMNVLIFCRLGTLLSLTFLGMALIFRRDRTVVYSENSETNRTANVVRKAGWAKGALFGNAVNFLATMVLYFRMYRNAWVYDADFWAYAAFLTASAVAMLLPVYFAEKKKAAVLLQDAMPLYVDDDVYWLSGNYNNPLDGRVFVQNRFWKMSYGVNVGQGIGKAFMVSAWVIIIGSILLVVWAFVSTMLCKVEFAIADGEPETVHIEAAMYHFDAPLADITDVSLLSELPEDEYFRQNGLSTDQFSVGHYAGREGGNCLLFLRNDVTPVIRIKAADEVVYVNGESAAETEMWLNELQGAR